MKLYHGSNVEVCEPDLSRSKPYKDFGQGVYLSADKGQAARMAEQKTLQLLTVMHTCKRPALRRV